MIGWFLIGWEIFSKNARLAFNRFCAFFEKMIGFSIIGFTSFLKKCSVLDYRFCNRKMIGFSPTDENINRLKKKPLDQKSGLLGEHDFEAFLGLQFFRPFSFY